MENSLEKLEVYILAREISSLAWKIFNQLPQRFQYHIGNQFLDSADSISANIAEGYGRFHFKESINFNNYARGSAYESKDWIEKLKERELCKELDTKEFLEMVRIEILKINGYNNYLRKQSKEK